MMLMCPTQQIHHHTPHQWTVELLHPRLCRDVVLGVTSHGAFSDKAVPVRNPLPILLLVTSVKTQ